MGSFNFCKKRSQRYKIKKHGSFSNSNSQSRLPLLFERRPWYPSTFPTIIYQIYYLKCKSIIECISNACSMIILNGFIFIQEYINKSKLMKEKEEVATKQEAELLRLEEKIEAEKDARIRLRESSDVVVECIKALQRKLQNETQLRESFVQNSQIEKTAQNKKIDGLISRLNLLRTDLRRGITGMNAALNPKTEKTVESAAAGDA